MSRATIAKPANLHVPLPRPLYERLRAQAEASGVPATRLAREAIARFLREVERGIVREAIAEYAAGAAGTVDDLDPALEAAAVAHVRRGRRRKR